MLRQLAGGFAVDPADVQSPEHGANAMRPALRTYLDAAAAGFIDFDVTVPMADNVCFAFRFDDKQKARAAVAAMAMENQWSHGRNESTSAQDGTVTIGPYKFRRIVNSSAEAPNAETLYSLNGDILFVAAGDQPEEALRRSLKTEKGKIANAISLAPVELIFDLQATFSQLPQEPPFRLLAQIWARDDCQVGFHMGTSNGDLRLQMRLEPGVIVGLAESLGLAMIFSGVSE